MGDCGGNSVACLAIPIECQQRCSAPLFLERTTVPQSIEKIVLSPPFSDPTQLPGEDGILDAAQS